VISHAPSPAHPGWQLENDFDRQLYEFLIGTDWSHSALSINNPEHVEIAAHAVSIGAIVCHPYANFYVFSGRPRESVVNYVNRVKGRPSEQTGSVVTTPERIAALFDWDRLPGAISRDQALQLMASLLELGPFGFRGPARDDLPNILTAEDGGIRTVQVVSSGFDCPSNQLYARILDRTGEQYLYGTSGNRSRHATGAEEEPVHHRLAPLQAYFGHFEGFVMLRGDESDMLARYPLHPPMSATLLSFHKLGRDGPLPALVVERHGSLGIEQLWRAASRVGLDLFVAPAAQRRLTAYRYADEPGRAP
jgi:hypothetical protein